jgi:molecular chaperone DnaK (HSP70)
MQRMRRAAVAAGFVATETSPALLLAAEPEAAALTIHKRQPLDFHEHQRFMVIDMGGGTVDLVGLLMGF